MLLRIAALTKATARALNEKCFMQRRSGKVYLDTCERNPNALPGSHCGKNIICMSDTFSVCRMKDASVHTTDAVIAMQLAVFVCRTMMLWKKFLCMTKLLL